MADYVAPVPHVSVRGTWVPIAVPEPIQGNARVWHYTDARGLQGIIANRELWATSTAMLNDSQEMHHGIGVLDECWVDVQKAVGVYFRVEQVAFVNDVIEQGKKALFESDCYVVCASLEFDSLSSWRGYAGTTGFAVGLRPYGLEILSSAEHPYVRMANFLPSWRKVKYERSSQRALAKKALHFMADCAPEPGITQGSDEWNAALYACIQMSYVLCVACMKHEGFRDEREARLLLVSDFFDNDEDSVQYRAGWLGITPYIRLTGTDGVKREHPSTLTTRNQLPIEEVVVGPCPYPDASVAGLRSFLNHHGYDEVVIKKTAVPFR